MKFLKKFSSKSFQWFWVYRKNRNPTHKTNSSSINYTSLGSRRYSTYADLPPRLRPTHCDFAIPTRPPTLTNSYQVSLTMLSNVSSTGLTKPITLGLNWFTPICTHQSWFHSDTQMKSKAANYCIYSNVCYNPMSTSFSAMAVYIWRS